MENDLMFQDDKLTIKYCFLSEDYHKELNAFLDWLGDNDIVTAYELEDDFLCAIGSLYRLSDFDLTQLINNGKVTLKKIGSLDKYVNMDRENERDFYNWYYWRDR